MTAQVAARFLIGHAAAIQQVARSRSAVWLGIFLTLTAGIARQYDQTFIFEAPERWFLGSLLFSTLTGTLLFSFVYAAFIRPNADGDEVRASAFWTQWRSFMGCYWMTAPLAWVYAIPVERFLDPLAAVLANYFLLAIVAAWRVVLIARVCVVITEAPLIRVFPTVLLFACAEFLIVTFLGAASGRQIMAAMGGMENSPEESLVFALGSATFAAVFWILVGSIVAVIAAATWIDVVKTKLFPQTESDSYPVRATLMVVVVVACLCIHPQLEQKRSYTLQRHFVTRNYRGALDFLSANGLTALAPSRPIPPKLYENQMYAEMAGVFEALKSDDPQWLRDLYFARLTAMFTIRPSRFQGDEVPSAVIKVLRALKRLPGGVDWLRVNRKIVDDFAMNVQRNAGDQGNAKLNDAIQDLLNPLDKADAGGR